MASFLARRTRLPSHLSSRTFSRSALLLKKHSRASAIDTDDLFAPSSGEDDLFPSSLGRQDTSSATRQASAFKRPVVRKKGQKQTAVVKNAFEEFDEQYKFVTDRLGPKPVAFHPQVRDNAIKRLLHHSRGPEHLDRVVQLLETWRNERGTVDEETAIELIDRCLAWNPPLLVTLLSNKPKYGLTLPGVPTLASTRSSRSRSRFWSKSNARTLSEARRILHRLILYRPPSITQTPTNIEEKKKSNAEALKSAVTFAALMTRDGVNPPALQDLVCTALLAQACARNLVFAERLSVREKEEKATAEGEKDGGEKESNVPAAKRAPLGAASTRGLLSISSTLASLLSRTPSTSTPAPESEPIKAESETEENPKRSLFSFFLSPSPSSSIEAQPASTTTTTTSKKHKFDPSEGQKRMSGATPSAAEEHEWVLAALRDVVRALQLPYIDNARKKPILEVLEKKLSEAQVEAETGKPA